MNIKKRVELEESRVPLEEEKAYSSMTKWFISGFVVGIILGLLILGLLIWKVL